MLEVLHLEALLWDDRHRLDVHVRTRQREALLSDGRRWRDASGQHLAAHLLIRRHGLHGGVVLVGADEIGAIGSGGAQHRIEVLEDARGFPLALGPAGVRRAFGQHIRRDAVRKVLRHQPGREHPAARPDALGELDLAATKFDGQQGLHRR